MRKIIVLIILMLTFILLSIFVSAERNGSTDIRDYLFYYYANVTTINSTSIAGGKGSLSLDDMSLTPQGDNNYVLLSKTDIRPVFRGTIEDATKTTGIYTLEFDFKRTTERYTPIGFSDYYYSNSDRVICGFMSFGIEGNLHFINDSSTVNTVAKPVSNNSWHTAVVVFDIDNQKCSYAVYNSTGEMWWSLNNTKAQDLYRSDIMRNWTMGDEENNNPTLYMDNITVYEGNGIVDGKLLPCGLWFVGSRLTGEYVHTVDCYGNVNTTNQTISNEYCFPDGICFNETNITNWNDDEVGAVNENCSVLGSCSPNIIYGESHLNPTDINLTGSVTIIPNSTNNNPFLIDHTVNPFNDTGAYQGGKINIKTEGTSAVGQSLTGFQSILDANRDLASNTNTQRISNTAGYLSVDADADISGSGNYIGTYTTGVGINAQVRGTDTSTGISDHSSVGIFSDDRHHTQFNKPSGSVAVTATAIGTEFRNRMVVLGTNKANITANFYNTEAVMYDSLAGVVAGNTGNITYNYYANRNRIILTYADQPDTVNAWGTYNVLTDSDAAANLVAAYLSASGGASNIGLEVAAGETILMDDVRIGASSGETIAMTGQELFVLGDTELAQDLTIGGEIQGNVTITGNLTIQSELRFSVNTSGMAGKQEGGIKFWLYGENE